MRSSRLNVRALVGSALACAALVSLPAGCGSGADRDDSAVARAGGDGSNSSTEASAKSPRITLAKGEISIDEQQVPLPGDVAAWRAVLGPPPRTEQLAATETEPFVNVYIWDAVGIVAIERPDLAQVTKVSFVFVPDKARPANAAYPQLVPAAAFSGTLAIDGVAFDVTTTPDRLNDRIAEKFGGAKFEQLKTFPHSWNIAYAAWTITAITDLAGEQLVELAIGE